MSNSSSRLGRGLGSIIAGSRKSSDKSTETKKLSVEKVSEPKVIEKSNEAKGVSVGSDHYKEIAITKIATNPYQPRRDFAPEQIEELANSIREEGLLQPIVVRKLNDGSFQLIAGERRLRACQHIGMTMIPARIVFASDTSSAVIALVENLQRENLNPIDEAIGIASLIRDFDLSQEAAAKRLGKGRATIANSLRLLQLDKEIQGYISKGLLSMGHAKVILGLEDPAQRNLLARRIIEDGLSVREAERTLRKQKANNTVNKQKTSASASEQERAVILDLEKQIGGFFNTKVCVQHTPKKGKLVIEYYGNDDLMRILERAGLSM